MKKTLLSAIALFCVMAVACNEKIGPEPENPQQEEPQVSTPVFACWDGEACSANTHTAVLDYTILRFPEAKKGSGKYTLTFEANFSTDVTWEFFNGESEESLAYGEDREMKLSISRDDLSNTGYIVVTGKAGKGELVISSVKLRTPDAEEYVMVKDSKKYTVEYEFTDMETPTDGYGSWNFVSVNNDEVNLGITFTDFFANDEYVGQWFRPCIDVYAADGHPVVASNVKMTVSWILDDWSPEQELSFAFDPKGRTLEATDYMTAEPGTTYSAKVTGLPVGCTVVFQNAMQRYYQNQTLTWWSDSTTGVQLPLTSTKQIAIKEITLEVVKPLNGVLQDNQEILVTASVTPSFATEEFQFSISSNLKVKRLGKEYLVVESGLPCTTGKVTATAKETGIKSEVEFYINLNPESNVICYVDDLNLFKGQIDNKSPKYSFNTEKTVMIDGIYEIPSMAKKDIARTCCAVHLTSAATMIPTKAFSGTCMKGVELPSSVLYVGMNAFANSPLKYVKFNEGLKYIAYYAFFPPSSEKDNFIKMDQLTLPDSIDELGPCAFGYINSEVLNLPAKLETIHPESFYECSKVKTVVFNSLTPPSMPKGNEGKFITPYSQIEKVYVPSSSKDAYKKAFPYLAAKIQ